MAASTKRVVWDAACWIALIINETHRDEKTGLVVERGLLARTVHRSAERGGLELVSPSLALAEVTRKNEVREDDDADKIARFFEHDYILIAAVDTVMGNTARDLIRQKWPKDQPLLRCNDAIYLATAAELNIPEVHTFDDKLIRFSGKFRTRDGDPILIRHPSLEAESGTLLSAASG